MTITTLKDLEAVLSLCVRKGVASITVSGITVNFNSDVRPQTRKSKEKPSDADAEPQYTDEEVLTWSSAGIV